MKRFKENPIITKDVIIPSNKELKVDGVFNCGATIYNDEIVLLLRVAESYYQNEEDILVVPTIDKETKNLTPIKYNKKDNKYNFEDSRVVKDGNKVVDLTSLSHFRRAFSTDGINFTVDEKPWIIGTHETETWGIEDPRITKIEGLYYITYSGVSRDGITTNLITTRDFKTYKHEGVIFEVDNKDVSIFPEKINGKYYAFHRPVPVEIGLPNMWIAESPDLIHWGKHKLFLTVQEEGFEIGRIGSGAPSVKTEYGWLQIYHVADPNNKYTLRALLTKLDNPSEIISKTDDILSPVEDYEINGFFGNVVFSNGMVEKDDYYIIYYGAADDKIAAAKIKKDDLFRKLGVL